MILPILSISPIPGPIPLGGCPISLRGMPIHRIPPPSRWGPGPTGPLRSGAIRGPGGVPSAGPRVWAWDRGEGDICIYIYMSYHIAMHIYGPGSFIIIFRNLSEQKMDFDAILDADLDAQRDFAPQCIIQEHNSY